MKFGIEVEGKHLGLKTLFCQVTELDRLLSDEIARKVTSLGIAQIYVSDHEDTLTQESVNRINDYYNPKCFITIETLGMPKSKVTSASASYMIAYKTPDVLRFKKELSDQDQIKLTHGQHVITFSGGFDENHSKAVLTYSVPDDFLGDIEL